MRGLPTEANAREYINTKLDLTESTKADIGINQVFRLGRNPDKNNQIVGSVVVEFKTTITVETIINAARGQGEGRHFKEPIPDEYTTAHNDYIR